MAWSGAPIDARSRGASRAAALSRPSRRGEDASDGRRRISASGLPIGTSRRARSNRRWRGSALRIWQRRRRGNCRRDSGGVLALARLALGCCTALAARRAFGRAGQRRHRTAHGPDRRGARRGQHRDLLQPRHLADAGHAAIGARRHERLLALLRRDLRLGLRQGIDALVVVLFFLVAGAIFPFAGRAGARAPVADGRRRRPGNGRARRLPLARPALSERSRGWQPRPDPALAAAAGAGDRCEIARRTGC